MSRLSASVFSALVVACVLAIPACIIVPHPMTRHIIGMNGAIEAKLDYSFIRAGVTNVTEVREKLRDIDTGFDHARLFWGRWCDSHSGITVGIGGYGGATGGTGRLWGARNLFVRFDQSGTVTSIREFKDGELYAAITSWVKEANPSPLNLDKPANFVVKHHETIRFNYATITLTDSVIIFTEDKNPAHAFTLKPSELSSIDAASSHDNDREPRVTSQTLHFSANTAVGSKITVEMYARDLMDLAIYMRDHHK